MGRYPSFSIHPSSCSGYPTFFIGGGRYPSFSVHSCSRSGSPTSLGRYPSSSIHPYIRSDFPIFEGRYPIKRYWWCDHKSTSINLFSAILSKRSCSYISNSGHCYSLELVELPPEGNLPPVWETLPYSWRHFYNLVKSDRNFNGFQSHSKSSFAFFFLSLYLVWPSIT